MATNLTTIKEMNNIVMEGLALLNNFLRERVISHIKEQHPNDNWEDHYKKCLSVRNKDGTMKTKELLKEWDATHTVNILNLITYIFESKWHMGINVRNEHRYEETKKSLVGLVEAITKRTAQHRTIHYTPLQMFNDMITIAENLENTELADRLNRLSDEVSELEEESQYS